jgi:hypothetical protein
MQNREGDGCTESPGPPFAASGTLCAPPSVRQSPPSMLPPAQKSPQSKLHDRMTELACIMQVMLCMDTVTPCPHVHIHRLPQTNNGGNRAPATVVLTEASSIPGYSPWVSLGSAAAQVHYWPCCVAVKRLYSSMFAAPFLTMADNCCCIAHMFLWNEVHHSTGTLCRGCIDQVADY